MSDTPRTDDAECRLRYYETHGGRMIEQTLSYIEPEFARELERELAAVKAERDALRASVASSEGELHGMHQQYEALRLEQDRMRPVVDCRLCRHFTTMTGGCISAVLCVDARQFTPTTPRRYWKEYQK